jgi:hypothetical protein
MHSYIKSYKLLKVTLDGEKIAGWHSDKHRITGTFRLNILFYVFGVVMTNIHDNLLVILSATLKNKFDHISC